MNINANKKKNAACLSLAAILFIFIVVPVITVFIRAVVNEDGCLNFSSAVNTIANSENMQTIINSLLLGTVVVIISSIIAFPLAFFLAKTRLARHKWLDIVLMIPFMTPPYISSMGWILFMQKKGLFQQLFPSTGDFSQGFFSFFGLALIMSLHVFPFMTTILKNALLNIDNSLNESAAVCGGGFFYRLRRVTLALLKGNYAIGVLLVFVKTLSEYGTPATFGRKIGFYVFTTDIHRYATTAPIDFGKSAGLSSVLVTICMAMWLVQSYITNKNTYNLVGGKGRKNFSVSNGFRVELLGGVYIGLILFLAIGIPYFAVIVTSLIKLRGYGMTAGNYTLAHYSLLFTENPKAVNAMGTSFFLAVISATLASVLGTLTVAVTHKMKRFKKIIMAQTLLPEMLPNIVLVIGFMIFWNKLYKILPIYNTIWFMVLVFTMMFLPYSVQYVSSAIMQMNDNLIQAARVSGGDSLYIFRRITFPLILKGMVSGWMMIFIIVFRELVASSLIAPPDTLTVSTFIVREFEQGSVSTGMAMAVICVLLTTTALIALNQLTSRKKGATH
ncbi:MAG: iron ABC transporter permease [Anaerotignum sp.]|nr:iron ABC transporter permease [Anaerotignum sp.]